MSTQRNPSRAIAHTPGDLLTWEVQLRREGTLPPEVQRYLLEQVSNRRITFKDGR